VPACYHLACDDRSNVEEARLLEMARAYADVAERLVAAGTARPASGAAGMAGADQLVAAGHARRVAAILCAYVPHGIPA
jgi:hypothetical protein